MPTTRAFLISSFHSLWIDVSRLSQLQLQTFIRLSLRKLGPTLGINPRQHNRHSFIGQFISESSPSAVAVFFEISTITPSHSLIFVGHFVFRSEFHEGNQQSQKPSSSASGFLVGHSGNQKGGHAIDVRTRVRQYTFQLSPVSL